MGLRLRGVSVEDLLALERLLVEGERGAVLAMEARARPVR